MIVLRETEYVTVPWKNGGGLTREILKVPADAAAFDWRLSLATIESAGPFSAFDGYARTLVLVRGAGVELDFGPHGQATLHAPGQMATFDGAWATRCTLIEGPATDLNLIVAKERAQAQARLIRVTTAELIRTSGWEETLLCCISGSARIENASGSVATLRALDVARCSAEDGVVTCAPQDSGPALLFVGTMRHHAAGDFQPI
jgi:environmental stress-induced protein Ves